MIPHTRHWVHGYSCDNTSSISSAIYTFWSGGTKCQSHSSGTIAMDTCEYNSDTSRYELITLTSDCPVSSSTFDTITATTSTTGVATNTAVGVTISTTTLTDTEGGAKSDNGDSGEIDGGIAAIVLIPLLILGVAHWYFFVYRKKQDKKQESIQEKLEQVVVDHNDLNNNNDGNDDENIDLPDLSNNGRHPKFKFSYFRFIKLFKYI